MLNDVPKAILLSGCLRRFLVSAGLTVSLYLSIFLSVSLCLCLCLCLYPCLCLRHRLFVLRCLLLIFFFDLIKLYLHLTEIHQFLSLLSRLA